MNPAVTEIWQKDGEWHLAQTLAQRCPGRVFNLHLLEDSQYLVALSIGKAEIWKRMADGWRPWNWINFETGPQDSVVFELDLVKMIKVSNDERDVAFKSEFVGRPDLIYERTEDGGLLLVYPVTLPDSILDWVNRNSDQPEISSEEPQAFDTGLFNRWITWNGQNVLWLPPDYRPSEFDNDHPPYWATMAPPPSSSNIVAIGCQTGRVVIIGFSEPEFETLYQANETARF